MKMLLLVGGSGRRAEIDLALTPWQVGNPETYGERAHRILKECGQDIWVSCRADQKIEFSDNLILDHSRVSEGAAAGLRSAHQDFPEETWFILACDYTEADAHCVSYLISQWNSIAASCRPAALVFAGTTRVYEPLLGVWTPRALAHFLTKPLILPQTALRLAAAVNIACPESRWLKLGGTLG